MLHALPLLHLQDCGVEKDADGDEDVALRHLYHQRQRNREAFEDSRRDPEETVKLVKVFKFADEHGELSTLLLLHSHAICPHLSSHVARAL